MFRRGEKGRVCRVSPLSKILKTVFHSKRRLFPLTFTLNLLDSPGDFPFYRSDQRDDPSDPVRECFFNLDLRHPLLSLDPDTILPLPLVTRVSSPVEVRVRGHPIPLPPPWGWGWWKVCGVRRPTGTGRKSGMEPFNHPLISEH